MNCLRHPLDKTVLRLVHEEKVILAGGAIRRLFTWETPSDYDLFFFREEDVMPTMEYLLKQGFNLTFQCPSGKLFTFKKSEHDGDRWQTTKVQLICERYYPTHEAVIEDFDIVPGMAVLLPDGSVLAHPQFLVSLWESKVFFNKITYPVSTMRRVAKYACKGFFLAPDAARFYVETTREMALTDETLRAYLD